MNNNTFEIKSKINGRIDTECFDLEDYGNIFLLIDAVTEYVTALHEYYEGGEDGTLEDED